ncbi:hypothetical protein MASR2M50_27230 [Thauera sp.]
MSEQNSDNSKQENSGGLLARLRRPSAKSLGGLLAVGFVVGVLFWGGFNTVMEWHEHREVLYFLSRDA